MTTKLGTEANDSLFADYLGSRVYGLGGDDTVSGGAGNDILFGGRGDDTMRVSAGSDNLFGGEGDDIYIVENLYSLFQYNIIESPDAGNDTLILRQDHWRAATPAYVETVKIEAKVEYFFANGAANVIDASQATDRITINARRGEDTVIGTRFNDVIDGGVGADIMQGGDGWDTYFVDHRKDQIIETTYGGESDMVFATVNYRLPEHVEVLQLDGAARKGWAGDGSQTLVGNGVRNRLDAGADNDALQGGLGQDTLLGGAGDDLLVGGTHRDRLIGGDGADSFLWLSHRDTGENKATADRVVDLERGDLLDLSAIDADALRDDQQGFVWRGTSAFSGAAGELRLDNGFLSGDRDGDGRGDFWIGIGDATLVTLEATLFL